MINNLGIIAKWNTELSIDPEKIEAQPNHFINIILDKVNYFIKIIPDKANSTIMIEDSGIGMMKNEMINNRTTSSISSRTRWP
eukprot:9985622-Heterocapsa_arctica.AAC.1